MFSSEVFRLNHFREQSICERYGEAEECVLAIPTSGASEAISSSDLGLATGSSSERKISAGMIVCRDSQ